MSDNKSFFIPAGHDVLSFIDALPDGPRAFATWEEYERHLQCERDSWDHHEHEDDRTDVGHTSTTP